VASIGLVLAVPLTTAVGVAVVRASGRGAGLSAPAARADRPRALSRGAEVSDVQQPISAESPAATDVEASTETSTNQPPYEETVAADSSRAQRPGRRRRRDRDDDLDFSDLHDPGS
jgi:hypothetical protein